MIRKPLSPAWRIGLGMASALTLILLYTWLSGSRQAAARREAVKVAGERLTQLESEKAELESQLQQLQNEEGADDAGCQIDRLQDRLEKNQTETEKFESMRTDPKRQDRTIPSWSMLWNDGLVRAFTPQGAFERKETWIIEDFAASGKRLLVSLIVGVVISVLVGLLMGCLDPIDAFLLPPFSVFSKVPATAVLPIFFVIIQINFSMYVAIIVFGMLPSLAQSISASVRKDVPEELIFKAYTLGASSMELIWNVIFKQVLPRILDAIRLQIGPAVVLLVAAEWMVAGEGVGYRLRLFYQRTDMTIVFVYVFLLGILGLIADYGLIWLRRKLCPWFGD